jgi:hypothetical protein
VLVGRRVSVGLGVLLSSGVFGRFGVLVGFGLDVDTDVAVGVGSTGVAVGGTGVCLNAVIVKITFTVAV